MHALILSLLIALVSGPASAVFVAGDNDRTLSYDNVVRSYRVHAPPGWSFASRGAVVIDIHGWTANAATQQILSGLEAVGDSEGFLVVWPQGLNNQWNAGSCCGNSGVDDVGFLRAVTEAVVAEGNADPRRVYVTGLSNGGAMSHKLACEASDIFAAAAPMAFPLPYSNLGQCLPERPIPVLMVMGLTDALIPYHGGNFGSAPATFARWRDLHGCSGTAQFETRGQGYCETFEREACASDQEVRLCSIVAQAFPGQFFDGHLLYLNNDIVLAEEAWRFVSQFRRPPQIPGDFTTLGGVATLRLGRWHQRAEGTMWNVAVGVNSWVVATADGALLDGVAPFATTRRRLVLSLDNFSRAALLREIAAWVKSGTGEDEPRLSVDPRSVLRVRFDRTGAPRRLSGTIRLIDEDSGRIAGRMTVRYRR